MEISKEEWEKNLSVSGVKRSEENPLKIVVNAECKDPKVHRALKSWETKIQNEIDAFNFPKCLGKYREFVEKIPRKIFVKIKAKGYVPIDVKFSLSEKQMIKLLMGKRLYADDKWICIRELLQNAIDASMLRIEEFGRREGIKLNPKDLEIIYEYKDGKLIVEDKGAGMNEYIIKNYFAKIGECFYQSEEFKAKRYKFTPISRFGIGILSCFIVADKIEIETKMENEEPLHIEVSNFFDYFFITKGKRKETGTKVILHLKEEAIEEIEERKIDLVEKIKYWARCVEFPIKVKTEWERKTIEAENWQKISTITLEYRSNKYEYTFYPFHFQDANMDITIKFLMPLFSVHPKYHDFSILGKQIEILQNGIYIHSSRLSQIFDGLAASIRINLKKDVITIDATRKEIIFDERTQEFLKRVYKFIVKAAKNFSDLMKIRTCFFDMYISPQFFGGHLDLKEEFIDLFLEEYKFLVFQKGQFKQVTIKELANYSKNITFIRLGDEELSIGYYMDVISKIKNLSNHPYILDYEGWLDPLRCFEAPSYFEAPLQLPLIKYIELKFDIQVDIKPIIEIIIVFDINRFNQ